MKYSLTVFYGDKHDNYTLSCWSWTMKCGRRSIPITKHLAQFLLDNYDYTLFKSTDAYTIYSINLGTEKIIKEVKA